MEASHWYR